MVEPRIMQMYREALTTLAAFPDGRPFTRRDLENVLTVAMGITKSSMFRHHIRTLERLGFLHLTRSQTLYQSSLWMIGKAGQAFLAGKTKEAILDNLEDLPKE